MPLSSPRLRWLRNERVMVPLGAVIYACVFAYPVLTHLSTPGTLWDWDLELGQEWAAWETVTVFKQIPLWNPYKCGGLPMLAHPLGRVVAPTFPVTLMFGPAAGLHLSILMFLAIAWSGTYVLARALGMRPLAALGAALVFPSSSWFALQVGSGHIWTFGFACLSWQAAFAMLAVERRRTGFAVLAGLALAVGFLEGGPYPLALCGLTIAMLLATVAALRRSWWPLYVLGVIFCFAVGLSAIKLLPAYFVSISVPRRTAGDEVNTLAALATDLFSRTQNLFLPFPNGFNFWESGAYIGLFALPAVASVFTPRRSAAWLIVGAILLLLERGALPPLPLWPYLHHLPPFSSLRVPSRFIICFALVVAILAGFGFDWLAARARPWGAIAASLLMVAAATDCWLVAVSIYGGIFSYPAHPGPAMASFRQIRNVPNTNSMLLPAMQNEGILVCYEYTYWPTSAVGFGQPGYRGEQYLLGPGSVTLVRWTPNRLEYAVDAQAPSVMVVNQNYDSSWRVTSGPGRTFSQDGLLAVRVPAGKSRIVLRYISIATICGMIISILTAIAAFVLIRWESRRPLRAA